VLVRVTYDPDRLVHQEPGQLVIEVEKDSGPTSGFAFAAGVYQDASPADVAAGRLKFHDIHQVGNYMRAYVTYARKVFHVFKE
jgi:hypothetical protein